MTNEHPQQQQQQQQQCQQAHQALRPLPAEIAAAIDTIRWPLLEKSPAMFFQPLERMSQIRMHTAAATSVTFVSHVYPQSQAQAQSQSQAQVHSTAIASTIASDIPGTIQRLCQYRPTPSLDLPDTDDTDGNDCSTSTSTSNSTDDENVKKKRKKQAQVQELEYEYTCRIAVALILLGHGYTDEAHDLVSPLTWPRETPFSYGLPAVLTCEKTLAAASYAHALVHRREGPHDSEFGLTGFQNADYWTGAALRSGGEESLPRAAVAAAVSDIAATKYGAQAVEWVREAVQKSVDWEPRFLHELCAQVVASATTTTTAASTTGATTGIGNGAVAASLGEFAQEAAAVELKVLLGHTLQMAGYNAAQCFPTI